MTEVRPFGFAFQADRAEEPSWEDINYKCRKDLFHPHRGLHMDLPAVLTASDPPPSTHRHYPFGRQYILEVDEENSRGLSYIRKVNKAEIDRMEFDHTTLSLPPQNFNQVDEDGKIVYHVPGMIQAPLGVPFRIEYTDFPLHNRPGCARETRFAVHDARSLSLLPGGDKIPVLFDDLIKALRGDADEIPLWELMKPNSRTKAYGKHRDELDPARYDGSYSLASTIGEGQGFGTYQVASQPELVNNTAAMLRLNRVLLLAAEIAMFTLIHSLTAFEYSMLEHFKLRNHVPCFGDSVFTGCQLNVSSSHCKSLLAALGIQGALHVDTHDEPAGWTVFLLMVELSTGPCESV